MLQELVSPPSAAVMAVPAAPLPASARTENSYESSCGWPSKRGASSSKGARVGARPSERIQEEGKELVREALARLDEAELGAILTKMGMRPGATLFAGGVWVSLGLANLEIKKIRKIKKIEKLKTF